MHCADCEQPLRSWTTYGGLRYCLDCYMQLPRVAYTFQHTLRARRRAQTRLLAAFGLGSALVLWALLGTAQTLDRPHLRRPSPLGARLTDTHGARTTARPNTAGGWDLADGTRSRPSPLGERYTRPDGSTYTVRPSPLGTRTTTGLTCRPGPVGVRCR